MTDFVDLEVGAGAGRPTVRRSRAVIPPPRYYALIGLVVILTLFGLVMVLSASSVAAFHDRRIGTPWYYFVKQAVLAGVGFVAYALVSRVNYHLWRRFIPALFILACLGCLACFVPGVGRQVNGSRSWVSLGPLQGQPSELLKLALLLYCADLLARRADRMHEPESTMGPCLVFLFSSATIVLAQGDLGTSIVLAAIALVMMFLAGSPLRPLGAATLVIGGAGSVFVMAKSYRRARFTVFLNPSAHKQGLGYQIEQARISIASGRLSGVGLGASRGKWGYLPEAHTDFIAAIVGEELGFIGLTVMVLLLFSLLSVGVRTALRAPDRFGMLLAGGVTAWLAVQCTINLGAAVGLLPITGLPLPFISFGPSSLVCLMLATGLLTSVARFSRP